VVDSERLAYWRSKGALPSNTIDRLLKRQSASVKAEAK
jgi:ribosomal protein S16